ncbi:MAG: ATP-binding cassette domain-containing protein [Patescibacteria group bacterium]
MIKFESVTKIFGDGTQALRQVSFDVEGGELVLITGPSGSGKTTIMRLLLKEHLPTEGEIQFKNYLLSEIRGSKVPYHRRQIGVVFQDYRLITELNVWENIALPLQIVGKKQDEIESRVTDLLKLISLTDKAWVFPQQLSGGEAQRVSIARALATGPNVIFADEPTGNLDKDSSLHITKLFKKINELGTTVILATHDSQVLDELSQHRRIELVKGKINLDTSRPEVNKSGASKPENNRSAPNKTSGEKSDDQSKETGNSNQPEQEKSTNKSEKTNKNVANTTKEADQKSQDDQTATICKDNKKDREDQRQSTDQELDEPEVKQDKSTKSASEIDKKPYEKNDDKPRKKSRFAQIIDSLLRKKQPKKEDKESTTDEKSE